MNLLLCFSILFATFLIVQSFEPTSDYCKLSPKHIACKHKKSLPFNCNITDGGGVIDISPKLKRIIETQHNVSRNMVASGSLGFPPAYRMPPLIWNEELAYLAKLNVMRCYYGHDSERKTEQFKYAGQNIAEIGGTNSYPDEDDYTTLMNLWFDEYKNAKIVSDNGHICFKQIDTEISIGHFTAMISDRSMAVGCASLKYKHRDKKGRLRNYLYFVCNYAYANMVGEETYKPAQTPGEGCTKKNKIKKYKALCSKLEEVSPNPNPLIYHKTYTNGVGKTFKTMNAAKKSNQWPITTYTRGVPDMQCPKE